MIGNYCRYTKDGMNSDNSLAQWSYIQSLILQVCLNFQSPFHKCDMIKRNESDVGNVVIDILAKTVFKFLFLYCFYNCQILPNSVTRYPFVMGCNKVMRKWCKKIEIDIFMSQITKSTLSRFCTYSNVIMCNYCNEIIIFCYLQPQKYWSCTMYHTAHTVIKFTEKTEHIQWSNSRPKWWYKWQITRDIYSQK